MSASTDMISRIILDYMILYNAQVHRKKRMHIMFFRRIMASVLIVTLVLGGLTVYHLKQRSLQADIKTEYSELKTEMTKLEKEEKNLTEEISLLNNDEYVLELARTNYFLSKEDELIFLTDDK